MFSVRMPALLRALPFIVAIGVAGCRPGPATVEERPDFGRHFREAGATGTFVLYDPGERRYLVHDAARAAQRFLPASTFKIPNALIALETGVVADTTTRAAWDGVERDIPQWNRDHTLATAFEHSVVWYFQELARRIGEERMRDNVQRVGYGNGDIGGGIDRFWLDGRIRISAMEQVAFLERLHARLLPFSDRVVDAVEGIMVEDRGAGYVLRAKTGWALGEPAGIGWYVGYIVRGDRAWYFALNMDMTRMEQAGARRAIARAILAEEGLL